MKRKIIALLASLILLMASVPVYADGEPEIFISPRDVVLEQGEACVLFAERRGFTSDMAKSNLQWSKDGSDPGWISMGTHGANRQNEAYYIKAERIGSGTVTVSLPDAYVSDTINVTVVPKRSVTIKRDGIDVTSAIDLSGTASAVLDADLVGFESGCSVTWESSAPGIVSLSNVSGNSVTVNREAYSNEPVAVTVAASEGGVERRYTVYVTAISPENSALTVISPRTVISNGNKTLTIAEGETVTLSANVPANAEQTATKWAAGTDGGRVPVILNSTVGSNITITGRLATSSPVAVTAMSGSMWDVIYVNVTEGEKMSVKITGSDLGADGVIVLDPGSSASLEAVAEGFSAFPEIFWSASIAANNDSTGTSGVCPVTVSQGIGPQTVITADLQGTDFVKVTASVTVEGVSYFDSVYVKVTGCNIIDSAKFVRLSQGDSVTLQTVSGELADWYSNSQKAYFGNVSRIPTEVSNSSKAVVNTRQSNGTTRNPVKITASANGVTDSVYVSVESGSWRTVYFDLNGGFGVKPAPVIISSADTDNSILLPAPEAAYVSKGEEYVFCGWSENAAAGSPDHNYPIYQPGQKYAVTSNKTLYAVWAKKSADAMFVIKIGGDIDREPCTLPSGTFGESAVYIRNALNTAAFCFDPSGVDSKLNAVPSDEQIARALSLNFEGESPLPYYPGNDRIIWYAVKRIADDSAGLQNWHVTGVLVPYGKVGLTYDLNSPVVNAQNAPDPVCAFYYQGDTVTISSSTPVCGNDVFIGWNTRADGLGQWYTSSGTLCGGFEGEAKSSFEITEDTTLYAIWNRMPPSFKSHTLLLSGEIGVNFYVDMEGYTAAEKAASYMEFTVNGKTVTDTFDPDCTNPSTHKYYGFTCYITSVEMADEITAVLHYGEGKTISQTYSAKTYADYVLNHTGDYSSNAVALVKAIADYGHYVQPFLAQHNNWTIGTEHAEMDNVSDYTDATVQAAREGAAGYSMVRDITGTQIEDVTYSLVLNAETAIRIYLKVKDGYTGPVTAAMGGNSIVCALQGDGRYRIEIPNISAHMLGDAYQVTVSAGSDFTISVSALAYVNSVLNSQSSAFDNDTAHYAVTSLYRYYTAAMAYRADPDN